MKAYVLFLILAFPFYTKCQSVNIYSKWTTIVDEGNTQLILDLSDGYNMKLTRIKFLDDKIQQVDSFGYKRRFNTFFIDLGTDLIGWSGYIDRLHENVETPVRIGRIGVVDTNHNGIPSKINVKGELDDLSIYLDEDDSIEFSRMIYKSEAEIEHNYPTRYGGDIIHVDYFDEFGGFSGRSTNIGMKYEPFELQKKLQKKLSKIIADTINMLRNKKGIEPMALTRELDDASANPLKEWSAEAQKKHQLVVFNDESNPYNPNQLFNRIDYGDFSFIHYPFKCGINAMAIYVNDFNIRTKAAFQAYILKHYEQIIRALVSELIDNRGHYQNSFNSGYATTGNRFIAIQSSQDDFYFDEYGKRINIKKRKEKNYYLMFAQTFSVFENQ